MDGNVIDPKFLEIITFFRLGDPPFFIDLGIGLFQAGEYITTFVLGTQIQDLSENSTNSIQMRCRCKGNKELTSIYCRSRRIL